MTVQKMPAVNKNALMAQAHGSPASQATTIEQSRAIAEVQAMVVVAQRTPRSVPEARNAVLEACKQLHLAEHAFFKFPRGGQTVSGPSIHLAVELARCWGNIDYGIKELNRDDAAHQSEILAYAWDLQTNARSATTTIVPHVRDKRGGAEVLTDMRDIYENNANSGARRLREMIFRAIPRWLLEEAKTECMKTLERGESEEPLPQRIGRALQMFADLGISRERVEAKVGMSADKLTALDLANLRVSYQSIRRNEITAAEEFPEIAAQQVGAALRQQTQQASEPAKEGDAKVEPEKTKPEEAKPAAEPGKKPPADSVEHRLPPLPEAKAELAAWSKQVKALIAETADADALAELDGQFQGLVIGSDAIQGEVARAFKRRHAEIGAGA